MTTDTETKPRTGAALPLAIIFDDRTRHWIVTGRTNVGFKQLPLTTARDRWNADDDKIIEAAGLTIDANGWIVPDEWERHEVKGNVSWTAVVR